MYGYTITKQGEAILAGLLAGDTLQITRVEAGSGRPAPGTDPSELSGLIAPAAPATATPPVVKGSACAFVVECRNDLNGGLEQGFWLSEFGIYASRPGLGGEVLIYYATLGDYPQPLMPYLDGAFDVKRFPVSIALTAGAAVELAFPPLAFITAGDLEAYHQPLLGALGLLSADISAHSGDAASHVTAIEKAAWNSKAPLDTNGKVPLANLSDFLLGQMLYAGTVNAATASATLSTNAQSKLGASASSVTLTNNTAAVTGYLANQGNYFIVSVAGAFAGLALEVGDWLIATAAGWRSVDNTDAVRTVAGRIGDVVIAAGDINSGTMSPARIAQDADNRFMTDVERAKLAGISPGAGSFGEAQVRATPLTGLASNAAELAASDTVLQAFGKAMGRINAAQSAAAAADANASGRAATLTGAATLPNSGWTDQTAATGYWYRDVAASGVLATDTPIVGISKSYADAAADALMQEAWDRIAGAVAQSGSIRFRASAPPAVAVSFLWRVVR